MRKEVAERKLDDLFSEIIERPLTRRTLLRRGRDLGLAAAASSLLAACGTAATTGSVFTPHADSAPESPKHLVMLIVDAGRPDYLGYTDLPNIKALMERGTFYDRAWVGQLEATTPASHATIGTGCFPCSDGGVLGFWWEDPATGTTYNSVPLDGSDPDSLSVLIGNSGAPTMAEYVKRCDARAKIYTASAQKFYAADAVGGPHADYISYFKGDGNNNWGPTSIPGHDLPQELLNNHSLTHQLGNMALGEQDALAGDLALDVIRKERPRVVVLNLPEMDWPVAHLYGGPLDPGSVKTLMRQADKLLGKIQDEYKALGVYDQTVFMVLGDHGVTPLERFANPHEIKAAIESVDVAISFDTSTGAFAWLENSSYAAEAAAAVDAANVSNVSAVYYMLEKHGNRSYQPSSKTAARIHPALDGAYRYLLKTVAGSNAPHVVCMYPERTGTLGAGRFAAMARGPWRSLLGISRDPPHHGWSRGSTESHLAFPCSPCRHHSNRDEADGSPVSPSRRHCAR